MVIAINNIQELPNIAQPSTVLATRQTLTATSDLHTTARRATAPWPVGRDGGGLRGRGGFPQPAPWVPAEQRGGTGEIVAVCGSHLASATSPGAETCNESRNNTCTSRRE